MLYKAAQINKFSGEIHNKMAAEQTIYKGKKRLEAQQFLIWFNIDVGENYCWDDNRLQKLWVIQVCMYRCYLMITFDLFYPPAGFGAPYGYSPAGALPAYGNFPVSLSDP